MRPAEETVVRQCAPTLAGIKTGSLFPCPYDSRQQLLADIRRMNRVLVPRGLCLLPMRLGQGRALLYLYRPQALRRDLDDDLSCRLLRQAGYPCGSCGQCVARLVQRLRTEEEFPHEVGLFLSYPPEDVQGFIDHRAVEGIRRRAAGSASVRPLPPLHPALLRPVADRLPAGAAGSGRLTTHWHILRHILKGSIFMKKTLVIYWSGTGNTEAMAGAVLEGMKAAGADASLLTPDQVTAASLSGVSSVAMGCPAMGSEVLEEMEFQPMFDSIKNQLGGKSVGLFGSYGWGDGEWMRSWEKDCDDAGINLVCESITCCEAPDDDVLAACQAMGRKLAE